MTISEPFNPPLYLRNPRLQTFLASFKMRAAGRNPMLDDSRRIILETDRGVRLLCAYAKQKRLRAKGLVILIHGWEGSADSTYIRTTGRAIYRRGYDLFRLNLRDHGPSHHLNRGLFYATLLEEVHDAVRQAAMMGEGRPVFLAGFSLGGNFALRVARRCVTHDIPQLRHVVAISPVLDPDKATDRIDADRLILAYFRRKWARSLLTKQGAFPLDYDFRPALSLSTIREMTDWLISRHTDFSDSRAYFHAYSLLKGAIFDLNLSATILTAADDPIIPVSDFRDLRLNRNTRLVIRRYGGHIGFIENYRLSCWYENQMVGLFDRLL